MFLIHGMDRCKTGKSASRRLRKIDNRIPSVLYGTHKLTIHISLDHDIIFNMQKNINFYNSTIILKIGLEEYKVIIKSIQMHCFKPKILHIDFSYID